MIPPRTVTDALLAFHGDVDGAAPIGELTEPANAGDTYTILERPPGDTYEGSAGDPEANLRYRYRLRTVARHAHTSASRPQAEHIAHLHRAAILNRATEVTGDGWEVTGRAHLGHMGPVDNGPLVEVVDDFELLVVPGPPASP